MRVVQNCMNVNLQLNARDQMSIFFGGGAFKRVYYFFADIIFYQTNRHKSKISIVA